jgi:hypothetical protein
VRRSVGVRIERVLGIGLSLSLSLAGCTGNLHTLNRSALRASNPRSVAVLPSPTPAFATGAGSSAALIPLVGLVGWLVVAGVSGELEGRSVDSSDLDDPAVAISARLAAALVKRFGLVQVVPDGRGPLVYLDGPASSPVPKPNADLVLEVRTAEWGFRSVARGRYGVSYDGTVRLLDLRTRTVIAEGNCVQHPVADDDGPTFKELAANDAALLRHLLASITEACADDYRTRILGLYQ